MTILVAYSSRHGATRGVAERIADTLRHYGRDVHVAPVAAVESVGAFEAVVVGSAVYFGSWIKEAVEFVHRNRAALSERPVWLFSSGPLGTSVNDSEQQPRELAELQGDVGARGHRIFCGALHQRDLAFPERVMVKALQAPEGDFRDWNAIEAWATEIAHSLPLRPDQQTQGTSPAAPAG